MTKSVKTALDGTKTQVNLRDAASNEAIAHVKYELYSKLAKSLKQFEIAELFEKLAGEELSHAELWLSYLDEISDTEQNLDSAINNESFESEVYYPELSKIAKDEGFDEIADKLSMTADVEAHHDEYLSKIYDEFISNSMRNGSAETQWHCTNCGYHTKGNLPPDRCPLCNYLKEYFEKE